MANTTLTEQLTETVTDVIDEARKEGKTILQEGKRLAAAQVRAAAETLHTEAEALKEAVPVPHKKQPKKKHRLRTLFLLVAVAAVAGLVARKLQARDAGWKSVTPSTAPEGRHSAEPTTPPEHVADDAAGAGPDEALADAVEEPHEVTTPDHPRDVVELGAEPADEPVDETKA
jgi:hypothetical protein